MNRLLSSLLLLTSVFVVAPTAEAQLLKLTFKTEKDNKKFDKHMSTISGKRVLVCESRDGSLNPDSTGNVTLPQRAEVWIADPAKPELVPYKMKKGELVPANSKLLLAIAGSRIDNVNYFDQNQSFAGLSKEYGIRTSIIEEMKAERDAAGKGSPEWIRHHTRVVSANKRLLSWLENTVYYKAAEKLAKQIKKDEKVVLKQAQEYRLKTALDSVKIVETPNDLIKVAEELTSGGATFKVQESTHVRMVYCNDLEDGQIRELMKLAETAIDGFLLEFVDPYVDVVDYRNTVPEGLFIEFFFSPTDSKRLYERFLVDYYGKDWGKGEERERRLASSASSQSLTRPVRDLNYAMLQENNDLEGRVTHAVGHALSRFHYANGSHLDQMAWLEEAVGYYLSFEMLGRNSITCFQWRPEEAQRYRKPKREGGNLKEGEKTAVMGLRDAFNAMALEEGPKIDAMSLKTLFELGNADFAKGWSFYDYTARKMGKKGQQWLRAGCKAALKRKTMINDWREASEQLFDTEGVDIFKKLDDEWKQFAENEQDTSAG